MPTSSAMFELPDALSKIRQDPDVCDVRDLSVDVLNPFDHRAKDFLHRRARMMSDVSRIHRTFSLDECQDVVSSAFSVRLTVQPGELIDVSRFDNLHHQLRSFTRFLISMIVPTSSAYA